MDDLAGLADRIATAGSVVALTGAGISAPSGVPTFRGEDGVWDRFEEGQFTHGRFRRDPAGFWADRLELYETMFDGEYEPNPAHEALAALGRAGHLGAIVTQNTDGLHGRAARRVEEPDADGTTPDTDGTVPDASAELVELHGNAHSVRCVDCDRRRTIGPVLDRVRDGERPPTCPCGGVYKPDVVLFGERLPGDSLSRARKLARGSDVFLAIGSSLVVEPAASLPRLAARSGATLAVLNLESTPCDGLAEFVSRTDVTRTLPAVETAVLERS